MALGKYLSRLIVKEWLLFASAFGFILTSFAAQRFPHFSNAEIEVLFILYSLFVAVEGLQKKGLILAVAKKIESGNFIALKLTLLTFFLSMIITNDVALLVVVPLTLAIETERKGGLIISEALAANAGSAFTPIGNPQNLFIYWYYNLTPLEFFAAIASFSILFFFLLSAYAFYLDKKEKIRKPGKEKIEIQKTSFVYVIILLIIILTVLKILPIWAAFVSIIFSALFDRESLKTDYSLLFTFLFFFGVADNLKVILATEINFSGHVFLYSALISQVISNVPATLLLAKFTKNWEALLWGVSAGGFGSLFGSLANLIAYRLYVSRVKSATEIKRFTLRFLLFGYAAFVLSVLFYVLFVMK